MDRLMLGDMPDKLVQLDITSGQADVKKSFEEFARQQLHDSHPEPTNDELSTEIMRDHGIVKDQQVILASILLPSLARHMRRSASGTIIRRTFRW